MDQIFAHLVDHKRIIQIDSDTLPPFPNSPLKGDSLFVNCHYDVSLAGMPKAELLEQARSDTLEICQQLATDSRLDKCVAAVVTVYGHFPVHGGSRPARRRIYRVTISSKDIRSNSVMSSSFLSDIQAEEDSELDDVADLLQHATH